MRELSGRLKWFIAIWLISAAVFHLYTAATGVYDPRIQRAVHVAFLLPVAFILYPATKKSPRNRITITDAILALLAVAPSAFILLDYDRITYRLQWITPLLPIEVILGLLNIILLIEAVRRAVGTPLAVLVGVSLPYLLLGSYLPGILQHHGASLPRAVEFMYLFVDQGVYGMLTGLSSTFIALFIIFGAFIAVSGAGSFFTDLACRVAGGTRGGPAKVAVISSGLFGSISGSSVANVYTTGTFTIPLMKRLGYRKQFAGAVEATASTGGMLMPPIMGAGAFVMAELTGIPYFQVAIAAVLGAVFYYISLGLMVHFEAVRLKLQPIDKKEIPPLSQVLRGAYLLIPILGLVYLLLIGYSPFKAAFLGVILTFVVSFFRKKSMMTPRRLLKALEMGGRNMVLVAVTIAAASVIVSAITNSGLGLAVGSVIIAWSGGIKLVALLLVLVAATVLGMGLPATAAYIIAIAVGAPAMVMLGYDLLAAHLFVFYYAILSSVTPPVCITAYAAASIAGSAPLRTGVEAFRLAIAGFLIPFVFIHNEALLCRGSVLEILTSALLLLATVTFLAIGASGYLEKKVKIPVRVLLIGVGIGLVVSNMYSPIGLNLAIAGIIASILIIMLIVYVRRNGNQKNTA